MKGKIIPFIVGTVLIIIVLSSVNVLPTRTEISDIDIANVIGLDVYNEDYEMTIVRNNFQNITSNSSPNNQGTGDETISIIRGSYIEDLLASQTISDKYLNISHTSYYFLGSKSIDTDLKHMVDFLARSYQARINAKIYIVKEDTAKKFLQEASKEQFKLGDKLDNMEQDFEARSITKSTTIVDALKILLKGKMEGLIPVVKLVNEKSEKIEPSAETTKYVSPFDFDGLAIIKDAKLVGYLDKEETKAYNYIMKDVTDFYIGVKDKDAEIFFGMKNFKVDINFEVGEKNTIDKLKLIATYKSSFEEINSTIDIFNEKNTKKYKDIQERAVKKKIEDVVNKSFKLDTDFINFEEELNREHPYKYRKIKNVWEQIKKAELEVSVQSSLKTTFDIIQTNKDQEENK